MNKVLLILMLISNYSFSKDYISFRNTLNEANFWFYEEEFDSALVYYSKAEEFKLDFYPEEIHLYSRCLWELGFQKKSINVLKSGGLKDFFLKDTTYYKGLSTQKRKAIADKLKLNEIDLLCDNMKFYDDLHEKDQMYRKLLHQFPDKSKEFDSILKLMEYQDSLNFLALIQEIKLNGYPGGYRMAPIGPGVVLLHAKPQWVLNYYYVFLREIEMGRMSYFDFSKAIDRCFEYKSGQNPYNSYIPIQESEVEFPELIFINRCSIGMSPYYDIYLPKLYPRGKTPPKSKLYEYYKRSKTNFNCIRIK